MLSGHAVLALNYSVVTLPKRHKSRENRLKLNIHYHKLCLAGEREFRRTEGTDNTDHRSVFAVHACMFSTARKAYSTLCLSSAWELTWFVTGPTAETVWARLCEAVPPLLNYCKNCLYACEGIGMHSGSENDQPCGRPARFLRDALIGWMP